MAAVCPPDLFKQFENSPDGWARPGPEGKQFLYDALGDHMEFTDLTYFTIPKLDDEAFGNWEKFEYWCEDIKLKLMWDIVDYESEDFQLAYENFTPKKYFKTKSKVKEKIIEALTDSSSDSVENIMYVEIQCKNKNFF